MILFLLLVLGINLKARVIKGRVMDEKGEPLVSATVVAKELNSGVSTDEDGKFRLTALSEKELTIEVSFVGYKTYISDRI